MDIDLTHGLIYQNLLLFSVSFSSFLEIYVDMLLLWICLWVYYKYIYISNFFFVMVLFFFFVVVKTRLCVAYK